MTSGRPANQIMNINMNINTSETQNAVSRRHALNRKWAESAAASAGRTVKELTDCNMTADWKAFETSS